MTAAQEPSYRKRVGYQAGLLGGFSTLAAVMLMMGNVATHDSIELRQQEDLLLSLNQVLPAEMYDEALLDNTMTFEAANAEPMTIYRAVRNGQVTAVAYTESGPGYAGPVTLMMGVDAKGTLLGVRVISHAETPGLGDKIEAEKTDWIFSFNGKSLGNPDESKWAVKKDGGIFDQFSGATITPRGVVNIVLGGLKFFRKHRGELLARAPVISTTGGK